MRVLAPALLVACLGAPSLALAWGYEGHEVMADIAGAYLATRAPAFEPRIAALIANDGLYEYAAPNFAAVPPSVQAAFRSQAAKRPSPVIDKAMEAAMRASPVARWAITHGMWRFGASSPSNYLHKSLAYSLADGVAERIRCPTLVCDADRDLFFKGQPEQLFDHLTCSKRLITFKSDEGAGAHCEVGAARLASARMFDWLDETLAVG